MASGSSRRHARVFSNRIAAPAGITLAGAVFVHAGCRGGLALLSRLAIHAATSLARYRTPRLPTRTAGGWSGEPLHRHQCRVATAMPIRRAASTVSISTSGDSVVVITRKNSVVRGGSVSVWTHWPALAVKKADGFFGGLQARAGVVVNQHVPQFLNLSA